MRLAALLFVVACGGATKTAAPKSSYAELEARIPKMLAAMDQLAKDLAVVNDDCPKIAGVLRKWGSQFAGELDALWELKNKLTPEERERYEHEHDDDAKRLEPVFKASMQACHGNEEVEDALTVAGFGRIETAK